MPFEKSVADVRFLRGDLSGAAEMYLEGARDGVEIASFNYAYCLLNGYGVERDPEMAKSFFSYARDMEGGESCYNLAMLYLSGNGVEKDYKTAMRYMSDAADLGCVEAMLYLGMAYTTGYVIYPEITSISMIPFHKPEYSREGFYLTGNVGDAERDEEARFSVIRTDARLAFEYFSEAARSDPTYVNELVAQGKYLVAKCYLEGMGTEFNRVEGLRLMLGAGRAGSEDAVAYLAENGVTEKQIIALLRDKRKAPR